MLSNNEPGRCMAVAASQLIVCIHKWQRFFHASTSNLKQRQDVYAFSQLRNHSDGYNT